MLDRGARRQAAIDASLVVGITIAAHLTTGIGFAVLSGVPVTGLASVSVSTLLSAWPMLLGFAVLTGLVALSGWTRQVRLRLAAPTAVVAWFAGQTVLGLVNAVPLPQSLLWSVFGLVPFVLEAFVAGLIVAAMSEKPTPAPGDVDAPSADGQRSVSIVRAVALGGAVLLTLSLPWQWFRVYFSLFGGSERHATPEQGIQYLVTVLAAIALTVLAFVLASRQRRGGAIAGAVVVFCVLVVVGFVCQVPQGAVWIEPAPPVEEEIDPHWQECAWDANRPGCGG